MVDFEELLESEYQALERIDEESISNDEALLMLSESEVFDLMEELDIGDEEMQEILEATRRTVNSSGKVRRVRTRQSRSRNAVSTTGMSRTALKQRARKAARTRRKNPAGLRVALKRRRKAMRKRKMLRL